MLNSEIIVYEWMRKKCLICNYKQKCLLFKLLRKVVCFYISNFWEYNYIYFHIFGIIGLENQGGSTSIIPHMDFTISAHRFSLKGLLQSALLFHNC